MKRVQRDPEQQFLLSELKKAYPSAEFEQMVIKQQTFHSQIHEAVNRPELSMDEKETLVRRFEKQNMQFSKGIRQWSQAETVPEKNAAFRAVMALPAMDELVNQVQVNQPTKQAA
jgi:hypothetical protein